MDRSQETRLDREAIATAIEAAVAERGRGKTICPSEVARALAGPDENAWRRLMKPIKAEAVRLAREGRVEIRRRGRPVAPDAVRGIYRIGTTADAMEARPGD